jgi:hypothetical protein
MRTPKFNVGQVVRVKEPDGFLAAFAQKIRDRDAVVRHHIRILSRAGDARVYEGRMEVEFQKRNGRGSVFTEVMDEAHFIAKEAA